MTDVGTLVEEAIAEAMAKGIEQSSAYALGRLESHYIKLQVENEKLNQQVLDLRRNGGMGNAELNTMLIDMEKESNTEMELLEAAATEIQETEV